MDRHRDVGRRGEISLAMARNLTEWLRVNVPEGRDAFVAINHEFQAVIVYSGGKPILCCSFDELTRRPGCSMN